MDLLAWLLVSLAGALIAALVALGAFAATTDFRFAGIHVRGGNLRGAVAAALARILVADTRSFRLPLVVELHKTGLLGARTPLVGGATVRGLQWQIHVDGQHVSTVTEAASVPVGAFARVLRLPVDAEVHLPEGLVKTLLRLHRSRRAGAEVRIEVRGHVDVRYWGMTRQVPVAEAQWAVLGDALPRLDALRWTPGSKGHATLAVRVTNPYRGETLEGQLNVQARRVRRVRRDPVVAVHEEPLRLAPGASHGVVLDVRVEAPRDEPHGVALSARALWEGQRLRRTPSAEDAEETDEDEEVLELMPSSAPPGAEARVVMVPRAALVVAG